MPFDVKIIPEDIREKIARAAITAHEMSKRELCCPYCGFRVRTVYADAGGHFQTKCRKCKEEIIYKLTPGTALNFRRARK